MGKGSWTIGQQIALVLGASLIMLAVLGVSTLRSQDSLLRSSYAAAQANERLLELRDFMSALKDAESAERGYLITGQEGFLEPHRAAMLAAETGFARARELSADIPSQRERTDKIAPLLRAKIADHKQAIEVRQKEGFEPAAKLIGDGRGRQTMDELRRVVAEMMGEETTLLKQRAADVESTSRGMSISVSAGVLATIAFVVIGGFFVIRRLDRHIGTAVSHVQSSSAELQAAAVQQVAGAKEQVTASNEVSTTIKELLSTSRQIAESAQQVTQVAIETTNAARAGDQTVQKAQQAIDVVRQQVDLIVTHMLDLGRKSQEIGGILDIINELSEQTNILAINATIEAAGAGESGRRFAVVADEIRKLADRVGGSTKEIRSLIEEIRGASNTTVMATEDGSKAVDAGTRQFTEVAVGFSKIVELVGNTALASREIELSTKQQTTAVEQVNAAIVEVARTARETEASLNQTLITASELTTLSRDLAKLIQSQGQSRAT